jgi:hypothetical protein
VQKADEILNKYASKLTMASPAVIISSLDSSGGGAMTSAKGPYDVIVALIALAICQFSQESNTDLNNLKYDIDEAIEIIIKGMEE